MNDDDEVYATLRKVFYL